jgi:hypothetical protein
MEISKSSRRNFLSTVTTAAAATSFISLPGILHAATPMNKALIGDADEWLKKNIKGGHRMVIDGSEPNEAFPVIWTWVYYFTNNQTGVEDSDMTALCVLRHNAIPYTMTDEVWAKYKFGEQFDIIDNTTKEPAVRNPVYDPREGDFPVPIIQGIKPMQERGALYCVCDLAIKVVSGMFAEAMELDAEAVRQEWLAALHPGIQVVPSGVWALGRAQEYGCGYIYAGG